MTYEPLRRGHRARPDAGGLLCAECGTAIVLIEDSYSVKPYWRHKGVGYHWGDRAEYWRRRALTAEARLRELEREVA